MLVFNNHTDSYHVTRYTIIRINSQFYLCSFVKFCSNIDDERCSTAHLYIIKVRPHHAAPTPITLAESSMTDGLQAGRSGLQMSSWPGTVIPR